MSSYDIQALIDLIKKSGLPINEEEAPSTDDIEPGLEHEFDSTIYWWIRESNENLCMDLYGGNLEDDGNYADFFEEFKNVVSGEFKIDSIKSSSANSIEIVCLSVGGSEYSFEFSTDDYEQGRLLMAFSELAKEHGKSRILVFFCEDGEFAMYMPENIAKYLKENGEVVRLVK